MSRSNIELSSWRFHVDQNDIGEKRTWFSNDYDKTGWMPVQVPGAWDFYQEAFWGYEGVGWFSAQIDFENVNLNLLQKVHFNSVSGHSKVWVNGNYIGEHYGAFLPFEFIVTPYLKEKEVNEIVIKVDNRPKEEWLPGSPQIEWIQYGGLLQKVVLETLNHCHITSVGIQTDIADRTAKVMCEIEVFNNSTVPLDLKLRGELPIDNDSVIAVEKNVRCQQNEKATVFMDIELPEVRLWNLDTPELYELNVKLFAGQNEIDSLEERFGVRSIETNGNQILINGIPLTIKGVNRYDEYKSYGPTVPEDVIRQDLMKIKEMGANLVRTHYPQDPVHLKIMDEIGLLSMQEIPLNWWMSEKERTYFPETIDRAEELLIELIHRDKNHPCIIIWSMCNESGTDTEIGIQAMRRLIRKCRQLDPKRLVTFVTIGSLGHDAFDEADIVCINLYYGLFYSDVVLDIEDFTEKIYLPSLNHLKSISEQYKEKPVVLAEFGMHGIFGFKGKERFSESYQAAYIESVWNAVVDSDIQGGILWVWADYYHRRDFFGTNGNMWHSAFGPFGIVTIDRKVKESYYTLMRLFNASV